MERKGLEQFKAYYFVRQGPQQSLASQLGGKDNGKEKQLGADQGDLIIEPGPPCLLASPHMSMTLLPLKGSFDSSFVPTSLRKVICRHGLNSALPIEKGQLASMPKSTAEVLIHISNYLSDFYLCTKSYDPWTDLILHISGPQSEQCSTF